MDSSALIFVALALAWAVYLIPKALEHHENSVRGRTIDRFSHTMRVLARREPVTRRRARLVRTKTKSKSKAKTKTATSAKTESTATPTTPVPAPMTPAELRRRRSAAAKAARRRLRVVTLILLANAVVAVLAGLKIIDWIWTAIPVGVLALWLIACRLMVRREIAQLPASRMPSIVEDDEETPADMTEEIDAVSLDVDDAPEPVDPDSWDPVPVTLPTYTAKAVAPRSVRTIDLDSTGVWTSGRSEADSALVRDAASAKTAADEGDADGQRAVGS